MLEKLADKTILLTGCNGFLGRKLLERFIHIFNDLAERGISSSHRIYAIDNGITSVPINFSLPSYAQMITANAVTYDYSQLLNIDHIIHLAGLASPAQYKKYPLETIDVAVNLTRTLLDLSLRMHSRFVFFSSSEIYGNPDPSNIPTPETYNGYVSCRGPRACYDESKRLGETLSFIYNDYYGVHTTCIRPFNVYGPGMHKNDFRMIPNLMRAAIDAIPITIYGAGSQTRTFCFLDDAIEGILLAILKSPAGEVFNIGNPNPEVSMLQLIDIFNSSVGLSVPVTLVDYPDIYPADEPSRRCPDISKAVTLLGYHPQVSLEDGLRITYQWCLENY